MTDEELHEFNREFWAKEAARDAELAAEQAAKKQAMTKKEIFIEKGIQYLRGAVAYGTPIVIMLFFVFAFRYFKKVTNILKGHSDCFDKSVISRADFNLLKSNDLVIKILLTQGGIGIGFMPWLLDSLEEDSVFGALLFLLVLFSIFTLLPYLIIKNRKLANEVYKKGQGTGPASM